MARKTTGNTTTRSKKTGAYVPPAAVQVAPEVPKEVPKNGKPAKMVPGNVPANVPVNLEVNLLEVNLEEEIRHRAYELYLQRASAGDESGNEDQDWLIAEREIRSRHGKLARHTTA
jgi:hypothetical protein